MLVFWDQRLTFLATPKTGSTAIETALDPLAAVVIHRPAILKHTSVQGYHRFIGPYLEAATGDPFTVVAMMREPIDWLGSWYRFGQRDDLHDTPLSTTGISFDAFATAYCDPAAGIFASIGTQADFLMADGHAQIDHIFAYDRIDQFVTFLEDRLNCEIILPRVNVPPKANVALSPATESLLRAVLARDFALYATLKK